MGPYSTTCRVGYLRKGEDGRGITEQLQYWAVSASSATAPTYPPNAATAPSSSIWSTSPVTPTAAKPYLWTYTRYHWSSGTTWTQTTPSVISQRASDGARGAYLHRIYNWDDISGMGTGLTLYSANGSSGCFDVIYNGGGYFMPTKDGTVSALGTPSASNSSYEQAKNFSYIVSKAVIADSISMTDDNGDVVFSAMGGDVTCKKGTFENVTVSGNILAGTAGGQRIELDPDTKELNVYDSTGSECTKFEGNERTESELVPSTSSSTFSLSSTGKSKSYTSSASQSATVEVTSAGTQLTESGTVTVNGTITASLGFTQITTDSTKPSAVPSVQVSIILRKYTDSNYATVEKSYYMGTVSGAGADTYSESRSIATKRIVDAGYYKIVGVYICEKGSSDGFSASGSWNVTSATFTSDSWQSRHFKNGLCLSKNNENYFLALLNGSGYMDVKAVSNGNSLIVKSDGVYAQRSDMTGAGRIPILCFHGIAKYSSNSYSWSTSNALYGSFAIKYSSEGVAVISVSSAYKFTLANTLIHVTALDAISGGTNHNKAAIKSITTTSGYITAITVWMADDASTNDGNFIIDIFRI